MGIIRNFINIEGLATEEELQIDNSGHNIVYSEVEYINIPIDKPDIRSIYEVMIQIEMNSNRSIYSSMGRIIVLDGEKKYKIIYSENNNLEKVTITTFETPFNAFVEIPNDINNEILDIKIHIVDAYFSLLDSRKIYGHFIYFLKVIYDKRQNNISTSIKNDSFNIKPSSEESLGVKEIFQELSISEDNKKYELINQIIDIDEEIL